MSNGVKCNRCGAEGLGWCVSRSTRKHYLAWLVPTPTVAGDGITITQQMRPQPNLLHICGPNWHGVKPQTVEDARQSAAEYAAERAKVRTLGQSPQPIAPAATVPATAAKAKTGRKVKAKAGGPSVVDQVRSMPVGQPIPFNAGQLPFATNGAVHLATADVPGKLEGAVILTNALLAKGYPREIAAAIVAAGRPEQIAALLLK